MTIGLLEIEFINSPETLLEAFFCMVRKILLMAKRRNIKKEKAARNRAYAKQFKKKAGRNKNFRSFQAKQEDTESETSKRADS